MCASLQLRVGSPVPGTKGEREAHQLWLVAQLVGVSSSTPKGGTFDPWSGYIGRQLISLSLSLSPSSPPPREIQKTKPKPPEQRKVWGWGWVFSKLLF